MSVTLEQALLAANALAAMAREEYPGDTVTRMVETWTPLHVTREHIEALRALEAQGLLLPPGSPGVREHIARHAKPRPSCTCPTGFGQVCDPACPVHGVRAPAHTITGAR